MYYKADSFCNFLYAFLHAKSLLKRFYSNKRLSSGLDPFSEGRNEIFKTVSIVLKNTALTTFLLELQSKPSLIKRKQLFKKEEEEKKTSLLLV